MGVMAHGYGTWLYVTSPPVATGSNFTIECLAQTIEAIALARGGQLPPVLYLQMGKPQRLFFFCMRLSELFYADSASDNKSNTMMRFLQYLVEKGLFQKIKVGFLMVGHTHEDIGKLSRFMCC
jgi:glutamate-1-semialdehyde aminotransferase